jgi:hypothetical protein
MRTNQEQDNLIHNPMIERRLRRSSVLACRKKLQDGGLI